MPDTDETTRADDDSQEEATATAASQDSQTDDASETDDVPSDEEFDPERAMATIRKLRGYEKQAKQLEKQIAERDKKIEEYENANKSELERLQAERDKLKAENEKAQQLIRTSQATVALSKAGARHPELLVSQIPDDAFESDGDLTKAVNSLKKSFPELFAATSGSADGGASGKQPEPTDMNALIRKRVRSA